MSSIPLLTLQQLVDQWYDALISADPRLANIAPGSLYDAIAGASATIINEAQTRDTLNYQKHFVQLAQGSDLDYYVTDSYSGDFARPGPQAASTLQTFYLNAETNPVTIPAGTIVKTLPNSLGAVIRYQTLATVQLVPITQTTISVTVSAIVQGPTGNTAANTITVIESELTSSLVTCTNASAVSNGIDRLNDGQYVQYVYNRLRTFQKYASDVIESAAKTVPGIVFAQATEIDMQVIGWNGSAPVGDSFNIARAQLFVGTESGTPTSDQLFDVELAIQPVKAPGVYIEIYGVIAQGLDYILAVTLNPTGPHYEDFVVGNFTLILNEMESNMVGLPVCNSVNTTVTFDPTAQLALLVGPGAPFENDFVTAVVTSPAVPVTITYPTDDGKKFIPNNLSVVGG